MKKEVINEKGVNFGNSSYETITWGATGDIPILTVASNLRLPEITGDFFETVKYQIGDALPTIIRFTKAGYLKLVFRATVNSNLGTVDIQIGKNNPNIFSRRHILDNDHVELYFNGVVAVGDDVVITTKASVSGATLVYVAPDTPLEEHPAYSINLELISTSDEIVGQIIHHASPNLHNTNKRYIPIDSVGGLVLNKADYPIFYEMFKGTYIEDTTYVDELTFKVANCSAYPYVRGLPTDQPTIGLQEQATDLPSHSHTTPEHSHTLSSSGKTVDKGELGYFVVRFWSGEYIKCFQADDLFGDFQPRASATNGESGMRYGIDPNANDNGSTTANTMVLYDRQRDLTGNTDGKSLTTDSKSISATNEVKAVSFFRYVIADSQD